MTLPRRVLEGQAYMVTRRCAQRQLLLTPGKDQEVIELFKYCLAVAAQRYAIGVFCVVLMGNHYHLGVVDNNAKLPLFMALLNSMIARALNAKYQRAESFWGPGSYSAVALGDESAVLEKIEYMICNPVAAGLVPTPEEYPSFVIFPEQLGEYQAIVRRPSFFFRKPTEEEEADEKGAKKRRRVQRKETLPETVTLKLVRPPALADDSLERVQQQVRARVDAKTQELRAERKREGKTFLGREAILRQTWRNGPGAAAPQFKRNPRLASKDKWRRAQMIQDLVGFWSAHREASVRFRAGERNVQFPTGTYWYRVHFRARCSASAA